MQKVRSPTYAENYVNLARAVVLKVVNTYYRLKGEEIKRGRL